jgi:hypothetical protein
MTDLWPGADANQRSERARALIDQASAGTSVELVALTGMDLCALDGPRLLLFDQPVGDAWGRLDDKQRDEATTLTLDGLARRGLLSDSGTPGTYAVNPPLGLVLAARTRPAFAVLAEVDHEDARPMKMWALGDESDPLQALVVEAPASTPPGHHPTIRKMGALGWFYRYLLVAPQVATGLLTDWAITAPHGRRGRGPARILSVYWHRPGEDLHGLIVTVHGDGRTARLSRDDRTTDPEVYDRAGLQQVMTDLFTLGRR